MLGDGFRFVQYMEHAVGFVRGGIVKGGQGISTVFTFLHLSMLLKLFVLLFFQINLGHLLSERFQRLLLLGYVGNQLG